MNFKPLNTPQKKGLWLKILIIKPKKPNSAFRKIVKLKLYIKYIIFSFLNGEGICLQENQYWLIYNKRKKDLISIKTAIIRGVLEAKPCLVRKTSRSKYGVKKFNF